MSDKQVTQGRRRTWLRGPGRRRVPADIGCRRHLDLSLHRESEAGSLAREVEQARAAERASPARIVEAMDAARSRLERDLHDGAQQSFIAVALSLRMLIQDLDRSEPELARVARDVLREMESAIEALRELAQGIHPAVLSEGGLGRAVGALAARLPMRVEFDEVSPDRLPSPIEAAFYYLISESLTNAYKHAGATAVRVVIGHEGGRAWVEVSDDGRGGAEPGAGSGLNGLADRIDALHGRFEVRSDGAGTTVRAEVPCVSDGEPPGRLSGLPARLGTVTNG